jgi:hypothetical protein
MWRSDGDGDSLHTVIDALYCNSRFSVSKGQQVVWRDMDFSNFYLFKNHILEMILFHPFDHVNCRDAVLKVGRAIHLGVTKCHCGRRGRAAD